MKEPLDLLKVIPFGTIGLMIFGIPLLILASLCAMVANSVRRPTWRGPVLGGMILGVGSMVALFADDREFIPFLMAGALSGAICGWIYWAIAIRPRQTSAIMKRQLLNLFAASALAPYLIAAFYAGFSFPGGPDHLAVPGRDPRTGPSHLDCVKHRARRIGIVDTGPVMT